MMGYGDAGETIHPPHGRPLASSSEEAKRYPWRIAPFLDNHVASLYVGDHREFYKREASKSAYTTSLHPSFGMNSVFVGGHYDGRKHADYDPGGRNGGASPTPPSDFWVLWPGDAHNPSEAHRFCEFPIFDVLRIFGFRRLFSVNAPKSPGSPAWGDYNPDIPASLGFVSSNTEGRPWSPTWTET
ncbi:MAG: hypothetical protein U5L04_01255 [Trueperaceae bacterium]|nr:hypothetical protein [Trueperaceae bacterium]